LTTSRLKIRIESKSPVNAPEDALELCELSSGFLIFLVGTSRHSFSQIGPANSLIMPKNFPVKYWRLAHN
jgi:hypothetical protein